MPEIQQFKDKHRGQTAAILCGGPSLPLDLHRIPDVDIFIGVNQHANILPLDYLVFGDRHMWDLVKDVPGCMFITHLKKFPTKRTIVADIWPSMGYSGMRAIYAADWMGFDTIHVCGMNQYDHNEKREYWWEGPQCLQMQTHQPRSSDLERLKSFIDSLTHPERIYFASGQLKEMHQ